MTAAPRAVSKIVRGTKQMEGAGARKHQDSLLEVGGGRGVLSEALVAG